MPGTVLDTWDTAALEALRETLRLGWGERK